MKSFLILQKLRQIRNKLLGEPKLEKGCQFIPKENTVSLSNSRIYTITEECVEPKIQGLKDAPYYYVNEYHYETGKQQVVNKKLIKTILGKPVSTNDLLLMIPDSCITSAGSIMKGIDGSRMYYEFKFLGIELNLTQEIEDQKEEVLEKLISLLKK